MPSRFRVWEKICKAMKGLSEQIKEHPRSSFRFKHNSQQNFAAWHRAEEKKKVIRNVTVIAVSWKGFMLLSAAIYSCFVKMRHRLQDDEKRSNHPLELSDKAASIWNELSEPISPSAKKPEKTEGKGGDGKPKEDKQQSTGKGSNAALYPRNQTWTANKASTITSTISYQCFAKMLRNFFIQ